MIDFRKIATLLNLDPRCLHWQAKVTPAEALEFSARSEQYNAWTPLRAVTLIEVVNNAIPPMQFGPDNPNTGQTHHTYKVGRSYSRELHVRIVKAYMPNDWDYTLLAAKFRSWGKDAKSDEADVTEETDGCFTFRWWWD